MYLYDGWSSNSFYPNFKSSLLKTVAPLRSAVSLSIVGAMCLVLKIAPCMSTQNRISFGFLGLGGITILDTHSVGPKTFSIKPSCSNFCISAATFVRMWNGVFETANPVTYAWVLCKKSLRSQHLRVIWKVLSWLVWRLMLHREHWVEEVCDLFGREKLSLLCWFLTRTWGAFLERPGNLSGPNSNS